MTEKSSEQILALTRQRLAERKAQAEQQERLQAHEAQQRRSRRWVYVFLGTVAGLLLALLFTPGMPLQWKMYAVVHGVCAQQNNVFLAGMQFPICARNTGIYSSFLLSLGVLLALGRGRAGHVPPWHISVTLVAFVLVMAFDGFNSLLYDIGIANLYTPRNDLRTLSGLGMGLAVAVGVLLVFNLSLRKDIDSALPAVKNWLEMGGLMLLNLLVLVAIYGNLDFLYWPLALISFVGITSVLYIVSLLVCSLLMGYEGAVTHLSQLARPATVAFIPAAMILGALAYLRFWLEGQGLML